MSKIRVRVEAYSFFVEFHFFKPANNANVVFVILVLLFLVSEFCERVYNYTVNDIEHDESNEQEKGKVKQKSNVIEGRVIRLVIRIPT